MTPRAKIKQKWPRRGLGWQGWVGGAAARASHLQVVVQTRPCCVPRCPPPAIEGSGGSGLPSKVLARSSETLAPGPLHTPEATPGPGFLAAFLPRKHLLSRDAMNCHKIVIRSGEGLGHHMQTTDLGCRDGIEYLWGPHPHPINRAKGKWIVSTRNFPRCTLWSHQSTGCLFLCLPVPLVCARQWVGGVASGSGASG